MRLAHKKKNNVVRFTVILSVLFALLTLYLHIGARLSVTMTDISVVSASEMKDSFEAVRSAILTGDLDGAYTQSVSSDADEYVFVTYTAHVRNYGILPAEWVLLGVQHKDRDVALLTGTQQDIAAFRAGTVTCVLLTTREAAQETRLAWADYYIWGKSFSAAARGGALQ